MSFEVDGPKLDSKYELFRKEIQDFVNTNLVSCASNIYKKEEFPVEIIKRLGEKGYLGIPYAKEYGGLGLDYLSYAIAAEEVSRVCASTGLTLCAHTSLGTFPIYRFGNEAQKKKYVTQLASGKILGAFGLTEPNAGSDAAATETTAKQVEGGFILNGTKRFITSAEYAGTVVVAATHDKSLGIKGISCFIVETGFKGYSIGQREHKLGLLASNTVELIFEDCFVPAENLLGKQYNGYKIFMETLDGGRISIGGHALGIAQGAFDVGLEWLKNHPIRSQQASKIIADITTHIYAARLMVYDAAMKKDQNIRVDQEAAMAKLYASEIGTWAAGEVIRLIGYEALTNELAAERFYRDAKLSEIGEGTSEVMRLIIAREMIRKFKDEKADVFRK
ncbi:MAG: acyl-CoA dehydrogenase family protein [Candidatus Latescibacteria bacterium]|nr:acyl-CoA dehydrogenase family protein [Candidatus Latescibacterota bacterium]